MKKILVLLSAIMMIISLCACGTTSLYTSSSSYSSSGITSNKTSSTTSSTSVHFTNKYGTSSTKCAHSGCNEYIAPSGDTNCCTKHSRKCLECGKYIDEDALYCIDCLAMAADKVSSGSSTQTVFTNKYGTSTTKCAHSGCNEYIASSGDTNCCTKHSNKCSSCGKNIDEDALYCIDCIVSAFN